LQRSTNPEDRRLADVFASISELRSAFAAFEKKIADPTSLLPASYVLEVMRPLTRIERSLSRQNYSPEVIELRRQLRRQGARLQKEVEQMADPRRALGLSEKDRARIQTLNGIGHLLDDLESENAHIAVDKTKSLLAELSTQKEQE
jgi:hypothetical protein